MIELMAGNIFTCGHISLDAMEGGWGLDYNKELCHFCRQIPQAGGSNTTRQLWSKELWHG